MAPWMIAMLSGKRRLITETYTASRTWVCPLGVSNLVSVVGKGQNGTNDSSVAANAAVIDVIYRTDASTGTGYATWGNFQGIAAAVAADINDNGSASFNQSIVYVWPDGTNDLTSYAQSITGAVPGSASAATDAGWQTSGEISNSGSNFVNYSASVPGVAGSNTTGFTKTFSGGAANTAAIAVTYNNIAVVGGMSYSLVIPAGGYITLSYYG